MTPTRRTSRRIGDSHRPSFSSTPTTIKEGLDKESHLRFIPLGGLEEIGRNMSVFEYEDEILIIDMGLQFPEEDTPGIDYIIPNISYLLGKRDKIKGIIITHGHYDHIGAIPYLMDKLGPQIPIYATALTKEIIKKRQEDFVNAPKLNLEVVKGGDILRLSKHFEVEFFDIVHTIPDSIGLILKTPVGNMAYCTDLKIDYDLEGNPKEKDIETFKRVAQKNIHTLFLESTAAEKPGKSIPEELVVKNLEEIIKKAEGRVIVGLFASLLTRINDLLQIAQKYDRKVFLSGLSLKNNVRIAQNLGYIKVKKGTILNIEEIGKYKDEKILVISTGAQGEPNASLVKIANGENKYLSVKKGDTIIFSSSIIPGNERQIQILKDNLTRQHARVIQTQHIDIHSSGHGPAEDLKTVIKIISPKFFIPIHGWYFMRAANAQLAKEVGVPLENCFLVDNGQVVKIYEKKVVVSQETVPASYVMVDGLGVGDVEEVVVRDRTVLAQEGMMVLIVTLDRRTGRFLKNPDIISRGFIYLRGSKELVEEIRKKLKNLINRIPRFQSVDSDYLKNLIKDQIGQFVYNKTKRRPMILPVIIEV
ncbi:MAG: ribonuclease J [Candidatus Parcubacteria bacterium]|nr:ribonuclease J [Patescibacteria group bacterium]BCX15929.1 MAG: ribonuclease J [Candidatus Parcubacteria bacterium]